jgi:hypothetical protein
MSETRITISELPDYGSVQGTDRIAVDRLGAAVTAGAFVVDQAYQIVTVGSTNFAGIGAASNTVGAYFVATGAGSGSGTAAPINTGDVAASAIAALATKATVGLDNADNTSDLGKPISTATQTALDGKAPTGPIGSSGLTMAAGILGRESGTGAPQVFTLGSGLAIVGGALVVTGGGGGGGGGYPSLSMPTGFSVSGSGTASLGVTFATGYSLPTTAKQTDWDAAYSERLRWDGSSTGLNAATARTSLGLGSAATAASSDFATAAQGALAATAVQPAALSSYQPLDSDLASIAALTTTTFGRSLLTQADADAARTALGAGTSSLVVSTSAPQPLAATAAAGSTGQAADAGHVHARSTYVDLGPVADGIVFTISNRGETATASMSYDESLPLSFPVTITKITFITHIDNTGSSTTTLSAYKRTAAGVKTSLLSANATLTAGASVATGPLSGTAGVLSSAAGDRLGVDLIGLGTGASGIKCIIEYTRSPA